jgi:hypothetical protein
LVACLSERELRWFDLRAEEELQIDGDGVCRIRTFPGLWIHGESLFAKDSARLLSILEQGLATPEHGAFIAALQARQQTNNQ